MYKIYLNYTFTIYMFFVAFLFFVCYFLNLKCFLNFISINLNLSQVGRKVQSKCVRNTNWNFDILVCTMTYMFHDMLHNF